MEIDKVKYPKTIDIKGDRRLPYSNYITKEGSYKIIGSKFELDSVDQKRKSFYVEEVNN